MSTRKNSKVLLLCCSMLALTSANPLLKQTVPEPADPEVDETDLELFFDYTNAFLAGFKSQETLPSATNCTKYLEQSIQVLKASNDAWKDDEHTQDWGPSDYIFDTTKWVSFSLAPASKSCVMTTLEMYSWGVLKTTQFDSFGELFAAWLQSLLGNVITFNSLYKKIEEANLAQNWREVYYWYGRFTTLFINFEPIETDDISDLDTFDDDFLFSYDAAMPAMSSFGLGLKAAQDKINSQNDVEHLLRTSVVNSKEKKGPVVGGFFGNSYGFTSGFINASFGDASPNSKICQSNVTLIIDQSTEFWDQVTEGSQASLNASAASFEKILGSVHPITFSCFVSVFEFEETAEFYKETMTDFSKVTYNLIHQLGNIYDTIFYLVRHQKTYGEWADGADEESSNWWFKLGIYYGTATFLMFYTPLEVDPYDPMDEYTGLEDGDHLEDGDDL